MRRINHFFCKTKASKDVGSDLERRSRDAEGSHVIDAEEAPLDATNKPRTDGGVEAVAPSASPGWDVSTIAAPFRGIEGLRRRARAQACVDAGIRLLDLGPLLEARMPRLGEGLFAEVFATRCPGLPPLCVKSFKDHFTIAPYKEAQTLHALRGVPGLPRLVGLCPAPPALLMTRHGDTTLASWIDSHMALIPCLEILLDLAGILEGLHSQGFAHNDLKDDNVMLDFELGQVRVTLIDLGLATKFCQCPFIYNRGRSRDALESQRSENHFHLSPELFRGGPAAPSTDIYSFGALVEMLMEQLEGEAIPEVNRLIQECTDTCPQRRPSIQDVKKRLARLLCARREGDPRATRLLR
ncbi:uncharacterized protein LOC134770413 [Penaeus indicus]|uniref:uncharacterized protein LOC134770413 n=1 Tax=Penaeus indicus TaxID=29960 RepID=UPI00300D9E7F